MHSILFVTFLREASCLSEASSLSDASCLSEALSVNKASCLGEASSLGRGVKVAVMDRHSIHWCRMYPFQ